VAASGGITIMSPALRAKIQHSKAEFFWNYDGTWMSVSTETAVAASSGSDISLAA